MSDGISYLDDLLNDMMMEDGSSGGGSSRSSQSVAPSTNSFGAARPESFRGDFEDLEAILADIGTEPPYPGAGGSMSNHPQQNMDRPVSQRVAPINLQHEINDLEHSFTRGELSLDDFIKPSSPAVSRSSVVHTAPLSPSIASRTPPEEDYQQEETHNDNFNNQEEGGGNYEDALDQMVSSSSENSGVVDLDDNPDVLDLIESFLGDNSKISTPPPSTKVIIGTLGGKSQRPVIEEEPTEPSIAPPKPAKAKGVQVMPAVMPSDIKLKKTATAVASPPQTRREQPETKRSSELPKSPYISTAARVSRATPSAAATTATPARTPELRSTQLPPPQPSATRSKSPMPTNPLSPSANTRANHRQSPPTPAAPEPAADADDSLDELIKSFTASEPQALSPKARSTSSRFSHNNSTNQLRNSSVINQQSPSTAPQQPSTSSTSSTTTQSPNSNRMSSAPSRPPPAPSTKTSSDDFMQRIMSDQEFHQALDPSASRLTFGARAPPAAKAGPAWLCQRSELDIREKMGVGNFGDTHKTNTWRNNRATIKKYNYEGTFTPVMLEEIGTLVSLQHPNLIPLLGACEDQGLYVVWEYITGCNLHGFVRNGSLASETNPLATIVRIGLAVAQGMSFLHNQGILHRSLSPKNVVIDSNAVPRIRDYGLASLKDEIFTLQRQANFKYPMYDRQYIAPEILENYQYNGKVDVYSFGVLLWELFAGQTLQGEMKDLPDCPFPLQKLIRACTLPTPQARPTFDNIVQVLEQPLSTLARYSKPPSAADVAAANPAPRSIFDDHQPSTEEIDANREKLKKVFGVLSDLIKTPSDMAQLKAVAALDNLSQTDSNIEAMGPLGFIPFIVDLLKSRYIKVQEGSARVVGALLKQASFTEKFIEFHGMDALFKMIGAAPDDAVALVATKAVTMAAYKCNDITRAAVLANDGHLALIKLLRSENEFVSLQSAWALGQLFTTDPDDAFGEAFLKNGGLPTLLQMLTRSSSPAIELRSIAALAPLLAREDVRINVKSNPGVVKRCMKLLSSPQAPVKAQALLAVSHLILEPECRAIVLREGGLVMLVSFLASESQPLVITALTSLLFLLEEPDTLNDLLPLGCQNHLPALMASPNEDIQRKATTLHQMLH